MGEARIIYHGSSVVVEKPLILMNGFYKDFGYGFYCTELKRQARRWALTRKGGSVLTCYSYVENPSLKIKVFREMDLEWLNFVVDCRRGVKHDFDIVEGPMADDQVWDYVEDYVAGRISLEAFWALIKFRYPTHQIVFRTVQALQTLRFEGSEVL